MHRNPWKLAAAGSALAVAFGVAAAASRTPQTDEPLAPIPLGLTSDPARSALGARLYNDVRLSRDGTMSCATCHPLDRGGVDHNARAPSASVLKVLRNTPTVFNSAFNLSYNWDGSARSIEAQNEGVIKSPAQFNNSWPVLLATLSRDPSYVREFGAAYEDGITRENVLDALAVYQRSLNTPNSRFDRFLRGDRAVLSAAEQQGYALFKSFGCAACHQGVNVGGNLYQKFGVFRDTKPGRSPDEDPDLGRYWVTKDERDRETFRVPSLRNVELTAPYFHDGRATTLEGAVRTMAQVQLDRKLTAGETDAIVPFLRTLTGELDGKPLAGPAAVAPASASSAPKSEVPAK